ncbi:MAG: YbaB/EbfC family nucleoid-associated protein [Mycoplasmataceae bacterium]|jgi:DNA-binding YbaB/EbfC family protein|nr:YbaB/EbfC family nucleoid-associated protein [Mycoplasmataceae bacterium]
MNINPRMMQELQKAQKEMSKKLEEFDQKEFEYSYKNDSIVVTISGAGTISNIKINPVLIDPEDISTLEEMLAEAVNAATDGVKADRDLIEKSAMPKGMPGMF